MKIEREREKKNNNNNKTSWNKKTAWGEQVAAWQTRFRRSPLVVKTKKKNVAQNAPEKGPS